MKEARYKRPPIDVHLFEMSTISKSIDTESGVQVLHSWGKVEWGVTANECGFLSGVMKMF